MRQSSTKDEKTVGKELLWLYVQPSFKQLTKKDFFIWLVFVAVFVLVPLWFNCSIFFESPWLILVVLAACAIVFWLILLLKPHQQITYRIDSDGIDSEFRVTVSPLVSSAKFWIGFIGGLFGHKDTTFVNIHSSSVRHFDWKDIVAVKINKRIRKVTLQAGLRGKLYLWSDAFSFPEVISLVRTYTVATKPKW